MMVPQKKKKKKKIVVRRVFVLTRGKTEYKFYFRDLIRLSKITPGFSCALNVRCLLY